MHHPDRRPRDHHRHDSTHPHRIVNAMHNVNVALTRQQRDTLLGRVVATFENKKLPLSVMQLGSPTLLHLWNK